MTNGQGVTMDADGNMTSGPLLTDTPVAYSYNARNQLTSAGGVSYTYDAEGHRTQTTASGVTTNLVVDTSAGGLSRVLWQQVAGGAKTYYVYGVGLLYEVSEAGATKVNHYNYTGSTIARTNDTGALIGVVEYDPYGRMTRRTGDTATPFLFNGQYGVQTDENGLLCMRARYYNPYLMRFINPDPIGFSGGANWSAFADGRPVMGLDPSGLAMFGLFNTWGDYFHEVGQMFVGYGDAGVGAVAGVAHAVTSPIQTAKGVGYAIAHPVNTFNAVSTAASDTWNSGSRGQGRVVGEVLLAVASAGAGKAVATAGKAEEFIEVSRWGRAGLVDTDFVQLGGVTKANFAATGKWSSLGGNQVAEFASGVAHTVPSSALHWPTGIDAIKGVLGQRIFDGTRTAVSYGSAAAMGTGVGAGAYGLGKSGEANMFGLGDGWGMGAGSKK